MCHTFRINKALKAGAGTGSLGYMLSAGVLKDLSALTRQNLGHYKGALLLWLSFYFSLDVILNNSHLHLDLACLKFIYFFLLTACHISGTGKKSTSDLRELCVPGRVFFIKPRKLKEVRCVYFSSFFPLERIEMARDEYSTRI